MPTFSECADLANAAYAASTLPPGFIDHSDSIDGVPRDSGFSGSLFLRGEVGVVAFRGSVETTDWMHADTDMVSGALPGQLGDAFSYFAAGRRVLERKGCRRLVVVGHSLGGALAALVAARVTTFPVSAVTFNAPGCQGMTRVGRYVDRPDARLAETVDSAVRLLGSAAQGRLLRAAAGVGGLMAAAFQTAELAGRRTMERMVVDAKSSINLPSANARHVHNVVAISRRLGQEIASRVLHGYIGNAPHRVVVDAVDPLNAHRMGPLQDALRKSPVGAMLA